MSNLIAASCTSSQLGQFFADAGGEGGVSQFLRVSATRRPNPLTEIDQGCFVKLEASDIEMDALDAMSDADLAKVVRDHVAAHRASRATDDLSTADPSTAAHGGASKRPAQDAARAAARLQANDARLSPAERAAARIRANDYAAEGARDKAMGHIIPGYDRLV
jgi:hypothetical protein